MSTTTSTSSSNSSIFSGSSRYASDLQSVITRAVNIATLPVSQMQQQKLKLQDQSDALTALQTTFSTLASSVSKLSSTASSDNVSATASDYTVLRPTSSTSGQVGRYTINVTDLGAYSTAISKSTQATVSDPATSAFASGGAMTLSVGGVNTQITPASTSLNDVVKAINGANAGVTATIVNTGSTSTPNYQLSLESTKLGAVSIGLSDNGQSIVDQQTTGSMAKYTLNGYPTDGISTDSRTIIVAPGLSVDLLTTGTSTVTVASSNSGLKSSLQSFVTNYNAAVDALDAQRGQAGGALAGDSTIASLGASMRSIANYSYNNMSLTDLGITFDKTGKLQFDATAIDGLSTAKLADANTFLGTSTTTGFLKNATDAMSGITNTDNGVLKTTIDVVKNSITDEQSRIDTAQERVTNLQTRLTEQMAASDALIAKIEQQYTYMSALFQSYLDSQSSKNG